MQRNYKVATMLQTKNRDMITPIQPTAVSMPSASPITEQAAASVDSGTGIRVESDGGVSVCVVTLF